MRRSYLSGIVLLVAAGFSIVATLRADGDDEKKAGRTEKKVDPQPGAEMAAWMAANRIAKEHKALQTNVGTWDVDGTFWMAPGAPPVQSKGVSKIRTILGGRFIQEDYKADFMGQPFQGMGIIGYDTMKKVYVSIWMDTMTNMIIQQEGIADGSGETVAYYGEHLKPNGAGIVKTKMVYKVIGSDKRQFIAYELEGNGGERKTMILNYKRRTKKDQ